MAKYLDAVNFDGAVNPNADPTAEFADDIYFIEQKVNENKNFVEFELTSSFDVQGVRLPRRQIVQNICPWKYRGAECGYTGTNYFDINDNVVGSLAADVCGKRLTSCQLRFGDYAELPYGGFPAAGLVK
jgi:lambda family phage minor tail protein L